MKQWTLGLGFALILAIALPTLAFQRGNELASIPVARMEAPGYVEVGGGSTLGYKVNGGKGSSEADIFLRLGLSKHFEYGVTDINNNVYHHLQLSLDPLGTKSKQAHLAFGIKNVGWMANTASTRSATTVVGGYMVTSFQLSDNGAWIHAGFAESKIKNNVVGFGGLEFVTTLGNFTAEWDGEFYTFGYHQTFSDTLALTAGFLTRFKTPDYADQNAENFRIGLSFFDNPQKHTGKISTESMTPKPPTPDNKLAKLATANLLVTGNIKTTSNAESKKKKQAIPDPNVKKSMSLIQRGNYFYYQGLFQEALDEYLEFIRINPTLATGYINAGSIYMQLNDESNAKKYWKKALEIEPDNPTLRAYLTKNNMTDLLPDTTLPDKVDPKAPKEED